MDSRQVKNIEEQSADQPIPHRFRTVRTDKQLFGMSGVHDRQIHCVISFDSQINLDSMAKAIRLTFDAEPILGCRYVADDRGHYWERRDDLDHMGLCRLTRTTDTDQEIVRFLTIPGDPCEDPLVQARVFRSETDTLCIKVNHVVCDAGGVKEYIYLLASVYRKLASNPGYRPETNLGSRSFSQISRHFGFPDKLRIIRNDFHDFKNFFFPPKYWAFPLVKSDPFDRMFVFRRVGSRRFRAIKEYSRRHRATINDIMVAAYYRALFDIINPDTDFPLRLLTTVDLRRYLPGGKGEAICNLSGGAYLNIGQDIGSTLDDSAIIVRNYMNSKKGNFIGLGDHSFAMFNLKGILHSWILWLRRCKVKLAMNTAPPPAYTNMGAIDPGQLIFGDAGVVTHAFLTGPINLIPMLLLGITGFRESMTMSIGFCGSAVNKPVAERLLDCIESELPP